MSDELDYKSGVLAVIIGVICIIIGLLTGYGMGIHDERRIAVAAEVAHYTVNPETGDTKFEYITNEKENK